jgi:hypothetical protein
LLGETGITAGSVKRGKVWRTVVQEKKNLWGRKKWKVESEL